MQRRTLLSALAAAGATTAAPWAAAQSAWPDQPLRWVVPYPAGGGTDVLARTVAEAMRQTLGQQIVVDNRPGASTNIGGQMVATAKPDGNTFMSADNAILAYNEHLFTKLPFNPEKDFTYVGGISRFPLALVVHPAFEAKTVKEFLAYARANPGKLSYASPGNGSPHHLAMEMFKNRTKTFLTHIPYRGAAPALQDVMGGQVPCMFLDLAAGLPVIQSGKVRALAIGTAKRIPTLPNVPTLAELGVKDVEVSAWQGLFGPKGMSPETVKLLNTHLNEILKMPDVVSKMATFGALPAGGEPARLEKTNAADYNRFGKLIKDLDIRAD